MIICQFHATKMPASILEGPNSQKGLTSQWSESTRISQMSNSPKVLPSSTGLFFQNASSVRLLVAPHTKSITILAWDKKVCWIAARIDKYKNYIKITICPALLVSAKLSTKTTPIPCYTFWEPSSKFACIGGLLGGEWAAQCCFDRGCCLH